MFKAAIKPGAKTRFKLYCGLMKLLVKILKILLKVIGILLGILLAVLLLGSIYFIAANRLSTTTVYTYAQETNANYDSGITGAIYVPSNAYNAYQMWRDYSEEETDRDLSLAQSAGLNGLRVFTSYEYWLEDPAGFITKFEDFVTRAETYGIRIMPILFEDCGVDNTEENRNASTDADGFCVCSPCRAIQHDSTRFQEVDEYVNAFMAVYGSDTRLLAIEIMNEPHLLSGNIDFAQYALKLCRAKGGSVPLTMGQLTIFHNILFAGQLDIYQYHDNFPNATWRMDAECKIGNFFAWAAGRPQWLTESQRVRTSGGGWGAASIPEGDKTPDYSSLAPTIKENNVCSFFWCLKVKPAYLPTQRANGTFNGLFYEDGTPYSAADLSAIQSLSANTSN